MHTQSPNGFYSITENGVELILSPKYGHEIRNDKRLNFHAYRDQVGIPDCLYEPH